MKVELDDYIIHTWPSGKQTMGINSKRYDNGNIIRKMIEVGDYVRVDISDNLYKVLDIVIRDNVPRSGNITDFMSHYVIFKDNEENCYPISNIDNLNKDLIRNKKLNKLGI